MVLLLAIQKTVYIIHGHSCVMHTMRYMITASLRNEEYKKKMKYSTSDGATVRRFPSGTNNRNIFLACDTHTLIAHICNDNDQKKDGKPPLVDRSYAKHELSISSLHFFLSICLSFGFILDGVLQKRRVLRLRCIRCKKD